MTIHEAYKLSLKQLESSFDSGEARSIGRIVFEDCFGIVDLQDNHVDFDNQKWGELEKILKRILQGEPVDYITGIKEFYGYRFKVNPFVLIPRPETEELVEWIYDEIKTKADLNILDIGTGSGCIPIVLDLLTKSKHQISGLDINSAALETAMENNKSLKANVALIHGDIFKANEIDINDLDIIISNPPYILSSERHLMNKQVLDHEPEIALFTKGDDPLIFYRIINEFAKEKLKSGGKLFYEISALHKDDMVGLMISDGFKNVECRRDISGNWRMISATYE